MHDYLIAAGLLALAALIGWLGYRYAKKHENDPHDDSGLFP